MASDAQFVLRASVGSVECTLCVCDVNSSGDVTASDALLVLRVAVGFDDVLDCPEECADASLECPGVAQFALFANIRAGTCTTNADCAAFSHCDTDIHRCRTVTDSDVGWTGLAHDGDIDDPIPARVFLDCEGPAPCGECTITGHDPSLHNCRCANDNRKACFTVSAPDQTDCGGEMCVCYFGPPMPLSAGNIPICVLNALSRQPDGQANVDTGEGTINTHLREQIFLGISLFAPCPICASDPTPADGVRGGVCVGGDNDTQDCDAQAYNSTFPPPTGALYSLDCMPDPDADISEGGLRIDIPLTTGHRELPSTVPCGIGQELLCPCRVCSGDVRIPCHTDADCSAESSGTCSSDGNGVLTQPNACDNFQCQEAGGNEGLCATGPDDFYCDAVVRPDGSGLLTCGTNADCEAGAIGVDAGLCQLVERRACFLDPIVSDGFQSPFVPVAAAPYCLPPATASSINISAGLPGPGRLTLQTAVTLFCKGSPQSTYMPGTGGCPVP